VNIGLYINTETQAKKRTNKKRKNHTYEKAEKRKCSKQPVTKPNIGAKSQSSPTTRHEGTWPERRYSSYSFLATALDGDEWSASRNDRALALGKGPPVPIGKEAGLASELVWTQRLPQPGIEPRSTGRPFHSQALH
jgi:hypothetical protein